MLGFAEVILLLLGLSNIGLQPNARPPTPEVALQYAIPDADLVIHIDAATFVPSNYRALVQLPSQPQIKASPALAEIARKAVAEVEGMRGLAKSTVGIDLTTDISDATLFVQILPKQEPAVLAAARGKVTAANLDRIAKLTGGQLSRVGSGTLVELGGTQPAIGLTRDGVVLAGTPRLVRERLADTWRAPARAPGSSLGHAADLIAARPVAGAVMALTPAARRAALEELGPKPSFPRDVVQRHRAATLALFADGVGWTWIDRDRAGLDAMAQMSEGLLELMRAGHVAPRGMAKVLMGGLESYRGASSSIDEVLRRKADILKVIDAYTGDGNFKVKLDRNPATLRLDVRATGKSLSDVLPVGMAMVFGAVGWLTMGRAVADEGPTAGESAQPPARPGARPAQPPATKPAPRGPARPAPAARP
jgi:hypothetical protein